MGWRLEEVNKDNIDFTTFHFSLSLFTFNIDFTTFHLFLEHLLNFGDAVDEDVNTANEVQSPRKSTFNCSKI